MENYWLFLTASFLLWVTPGQDTIYIIARSVGQGRLAGIVSALGIGTGGLIHAALATAGISIIVLTSPILFLVVKITGGLYLIYLGVTALLSKREKNEVWRIEHAKLSKIYSQGVITNVLNPKVALFFIAFLPQFVSSSEASIGLIILGGIFVVGGTAWCLIVAFFSSSFSSMILKNNIIQGWLGRLCGAVYIGLGINVLRARI
ncbi:MAG: LysE family translocator [Parvibaculum sp.]|nr:LysE family translocator [Parvibaculum sp.]